MYRIRKPLPSSNFIDQGSLGNFFKEYYGTKKWVIPYYGNDDETSHCILNIFQYLTQKSVNYTSAQSKINTFAFGSRMRVTSMEEAGLMLDERSRLTRQQQQPFLDALRNLRVSLVQLPKHSATMNSHLMQSGNAYVHFRLLREGNSFMLEVKPLHYTKVAYVGNSRQRQVMVVKAWDTEVLRQPKYKPKFYPASSFEYGWLWRSNRDQTRFETVLHLRTVGNDCSDYYGRPNIIAFLDWLFSDMVLADHSAKVNATETVSKHLFALKKMGVGIGGKNKGADPFVNFAKTLRTLNTSMDTVVDPSSIGLMEYPEEAPVHYKLDVNRDSAWFEAQNRATAYHINAGLDWYAELNGNIQSSSGLGSNKLVNLFEIANVGTIEPAQCLFENVWSSLFFQVSQLTGLQALSEYQLCFPNKIERLTDRLRGTAQNQIVNEADTTT